MALELLCQSCNMKTAVHSIARAKVNLFQVVYLKKVLCRNMAEWMLLKRLLDAVHQHSTMIGRLWLTVMVVFRLLIVAVATEDVYTDEQEMFVCNTMQPGCSNICYDSFAPISQPRFWVFQIIMVSTPSLCFIIYTWHNLSKQPEGGNNFSCESERLPGHSSSEVTERTDFRVNKKSNSIKRARSKGFREGSKKTGSLLKYYVFHVCFRAALEMGFVFAQWVLFGFQVPSHFACTAFPCTQTVDCYASRPTEKTLFLIFMFSVGVFCICLNLMELNHLGWKKIKESLLKQEVSQAGYQEIESQDESSVISLTFREVTSTTYLPTLELMEENNQPWTCVGHGSPVSQGTVSVSLPYSQIQTQDNLRAPSLKTKTGKNRSAKQKNLEVWI
ncbi:gap junction delta-2 protein-like [Acipenser oxyrinchus oxyrinchus]|uniref:Gap junction delta-2 protein-like n=1 Tax=Acipenser oxyrinchus oxyrinchus TaxID=40147 RepID=A0AAD8CH06_ACIOX|nr:gap junction delta-2 protein-like [Acipenser oxyrinchus oxyrinchus]